MRNKLIVGIIILTLFWTSGCAKRDNTLAPTEEENIETQEIETEPSIYFTQGAQTNDETIPWNYKIDPEQNMIDIEWMEWIETETDFGLEAEQTFRIHTTDLLTFNQSDSSIVFSYLDEEGTEVEKNFEILSDTIVKDENNKRYEWLRPFR